MGRILFFCLLLINLGVCAGPWGQAHARVGFWWIEARPGSLDHLILPPSPSPKGNAAANNTPPPPANSRHGLVPALPHPTARAGPSDTGGQQAGPWWWPEAGGGSSDTDGSGGGEPDIPSVPLSPSVWFMVLALGAFPAFKAVAMRADTTRQA